jgi:D-alanyl-D-alanine carboxypeptidase
MLTRLHAGVVASLIAVVAHGSAATAQTAAQTSTPSNPPAASAVAAPTYAAYVNEIYRADVPGATYIVTKDGKPVFRGAMGLSNAAQKRALQPDDVLRIGSVTKQFTAVAILMLMEEGKLQLTDSVTTLLPGYPATGKDVTVEHLLTHTSGIPSFTDMQSYQLGKSKKTSMQDIISRFKNEPLQFAPGSQWKYNNSGYFLLGAIIEKVSGKSYATFVAERIFTPLGMKATTYEGFERGGKKRVEGYSKFISKYELADEIDMGQPHAAGALVSTVDDLARWGEAVQAGKLLNAETWKRAFTPYTLTDGKKTNYGYGWMIGKLQGVDVVQHGGGIDGFSSFALHIPSERVYVAVLSNVSNVRLPKEKLDRFSGQYELAPKFILNVFRDGDRLMTQATGQSAFEVFPDGENKFVARVAPIKLAFVPDEKGNFTSVVITQGGRDTPAKRIGNAAAALQEITLNEADIAAVIGQYEAAPNVLITITRDGMRVFAQLTGQGAAEIYPESATLFFYRVVEAKLRFTKDAAGKVTSLTLLQNGQEIPAKKVK